MPTTTVGEQFAIFQHYVQELELLDKPIIQCFEEETHPEPGLSSAKMKFNITRRNALAPLEFLLDHRDQLSVENLRIIEKTKERFLAKYPKEV